ADSILDYQRQSMSRKNVLKLIEPDVKKRISPELYNRTQPIVFNTLNKHDIKEIGRNNIDLYVEKIEAIKDISIYLDDSFFELFMDEFVVSTDLGARPFMRNMNEHIIYKISEMITTYNLPAHTKLMLAYRGSDIVVDVVPSASMKRVGMMILTIFTNTGKEDLFSNVVLETSLNIKL
ncbi:hypothetical protein N9N03_02850, partial [Chlamydiia bacterium]|nr:hypothetical protein [Chlamydiia bacterium]